MDGAANADTERGGSKRGRDVEEDMDDCLPISKRITRLSLDTPQQNQNVPPIWPGGVGYPPGNYSGNPGTSSSSGFISGTSSPTDSYPNSTVSPANDNMNNENSSGYSYMNGAGSSRGVYVTQGCPPYPENIVSGAFNMPVIVEDSMAGMNYNGECEMAVNRGIQFMNNTGGDGIGAPVNDARYMNNDGGGGGIGASVNVNEATLNRLGPRPDLLPEDSPEYFSINSYLYQLHLERLRRYSQQ